MSCLPPLLRRLCLACAAGMVFLLFQFGGAPIAVDAFPDQWDKLAHLAAYGAIAGLLAAGFQRRHPLRIVFLVALIGALDEWHQVYLPGRSASLPDFLTDVAAALIAVTVVDWLRLRGLVDAARCR